MRMRRTAVAAAALSLALAVAGCSDPANDEASSEESKGTITIGAFNFSESEVVANLYAGLLEKAGYEVEIKSLGAREIVQPALEQGEIDLVPEYLGTFTEYVNVKENGPDAEPVASADVDETFKAAEELASKRGLVVLKPAEAQNQNAFAVTEEFATANELESLSDLAAFDGEVILGGPAECPERPFCQPGLEETYGLEFADFKSFAKFPLIKKALVDGDITVGLVFSSDAGNAANDLVVLEDDKGLQTADNLVPVLRAPKLKESIITALKPLASVLTTEELIALNDQVENQRETPANAAKDWLSSKGLIQGS
jgi:osmoprotectant transport system substrate-binding protein